MSSAIRQQIRIVVSVLWLAVVGVGSGMLWKYSNTPNTDPTPPANWPATATIPRMNGRATLVMFVHPQCSCTSASMSDLAVLMAHCQGLVNAHVIFFRPSGSREDWTHSDLWKAAAIIPDVTVQADEDGREARLFHAETSGHTALYDAQGRLVFDGGITASRGHEGGNDGSEAIVALLHGKTPERAQTPVYGCLILKPEPKTANGVK
jgi:hypothetical protein